MIYQYNNSLRKNNKYLADIHKNEFISFPNKYNFEKKFSDFDKSILSVDDFISSEKINDRTNNHDETLNVDNIEELIIKPSQSNFDLS